MSGLTTLRDRPFWWQWPTILSLDAPTVAVAWQVLSSRLAGASLTVYHHALLFVSVWLSYSADRWLEGWRLTPQTVRTQRHRFSMNWRWHILVVWTGLLICSVMTAVTTLGKKDLVCSILLLIPTLSYLFSHQFLHRDSRWRIPKEICVASILTAGSLLYPVIHSTISVTGVICCGAIFFFLALANCLLISEWEKDVDHSQKQTTLVTAHDWKPHFSRALLSVCALGALFSAVFNLGGCRPAAFSGLMSAAGLLVLSLVGPRVGREKSRVIVDVALLTPLVVLNIPL